MLKNSSAKSAWGRSCSKQRKPHIYNPASLLQKTLCRSSPLKDYAERPLNISGEDIFCALQHKIKISILGKYYEQAANPIISIVGHYHDWLYRCQ